METITVQIFKDDVYEEVAKATDYTGAKLIDGDEGARDRILATDSDLSDLGRFWEGVGACHQREAERDGRERSDEADTCNDDSCSPHTAA